MGDHLAPPLVRVHLTFMKGILPIGTLPESTIRRFSKVLYSMPRSRTFTTNDIILPEGFANHLALELVLKWMHAQTYAPNMYLQPLLAQGVSRGFFMEAVNLVHAAEALDVPAKWTNLYGHINTFLNEAYLGLYELHHARFVLGINHQLTRRAIRQAVFLPITHKRPIIVEVWNYLYRDPELSHLCIEFEQDILRDLRSAKGKSRR